MIDVITVRGTGEPVDGRDNMLAYVAVLLDPARYRITLDLPYPASVGPANPAGDVLGCSEEQSVTEGVALLAQAIRATPNLVGLLGYSLGAEVVSAFLEAKARGKFADCEIAWVGLMANPNRAPGESIDPRPVGYGINGPHGPWPSTIPVFTVANPLDGITSCPAGSPLRGLADGAAPFSFAALGGWSRVLVGRLLAHELQPVGPCSPLEAVELDVNAALLVRGYLWDGQHTLAYRVQGYVDRLASAINSAAV